MKDVRMEKTIEKTYDNYYTGTKMVYPITYRLQPGFKSVAEAKEAVKTITNPENFIYIRIDNELYAVTMELLGKQCVVTKGRCYYRDGICDMNGFCGKEQFINYNKLVSRKISLEIKKVRVGQQWMDEIQKDIESLFNVSVEQLGASVSYSKTLISDAIILVGIVLFSSMVPVFYLNVMDLYMSNSPSRWKLWQKGITAYHPYTKACSYDKNIIGGTRASLRSAL